MEAETQNSSETIARN